MLYHSTGCDACIPPDATTIGPARTPGDGLREPGGRAKDVDRGDLYVPVATTGPEHGYIPARALRPEKEGMPRGRELRELARVLDWCVAGSLRVDVQGRDVLRLDGERREVHLQIDPVLAMERRGRRKSRAAPWTPLWEVPGFASGLARSGWSVVLQDGAHEAIRIGHGVSALTGHISMSPAALWRVRRRL